MTPADPRDGLLPDLPTPAGPWHATSDDTGYYTYTADQMRVYAEQCIAHARPEAVDEATVSRTGLALYLRDGGGRSVWDQNMLIRDVYCKEARVALTAALTPERAP